MGIFSWVRGIDYSLTGVRGEINAIAIYNDSGSKIGGSKAVGENEDLSFGKSTYSYEVTTDPERGEGWLSLEGDAVFDVPAGETVKWVAVYLSTDESTPVSSEEERQESWIAYKELDYYYENEGTLTITSFEIKQTTSTTGA